MSYGKASMATFPTHAALILALFFLILCAGCAPAERPQQQAYTQNHPAEHASRQARERSRNTQGVADQFDYYVLSLSWAPTFCEDPQHRHARECDTSRDTGFVIHGLWPQQENGRSPEYCRNAALDDASLREALTLMPDAGLARHEWKAHGTCSELSPSAYFDAMKKVRQTVQIPPPYAEPRRGLRTSPATVERRFAEASHITQNGAIRVHCAGNKLAEVRVCFTRSLDPRTCSDSVGECRASTILMDPVR
jgi:ribonuclease T2